MATTPAYYYNKKTGQYISAAEYQQQLQSGQIMTKSAAAENVKNPPKTFMQNLGDFGQGVAQFFTGKTGQDIAQAGWLLTGGQKQIDDITKGYVANGTKLYQMAQAEKDPALKQKYLDMSAYNWKQSGIVGQSIIGSVRSGEQIAGDFLQTAATIAGAGTVGTAGEAASTEAGFVPGLIQGAKTGAIGGAISGAAYGAARGLRQDQNAVGVAGQAVVGGATGAVTGAVVGGVIGGIQGNARLSQIETAGMPPTDENAAAANGKITTDALGNRHFQDPSAEDVRLQNIVEQEGLFDNTQNVGQRMDNVTDAGAAEVKNQLLPQFEGKTGDMDEFQNSVPQDENGNYTPEVPQSIKNSPKLSGTYTTQYNKLMSDLEDRDPDTLEEFWKAKTQIASETYKNMPTEVADRNAAQLANSSFYNNLNKYIAGKTDDPEAYMQSMSKLDDYFKINENQIDWMKYKGIPTPVTAQLSQGLATTWQRYVISGTVGAIAMGTAYTLFRKPIENALSGLGL